MTRLEFWPDYGPGPLWAAGQPIDLHTLGVPDELVRRLEAWNARYAEDKLHLDGSGDSAWLSEGRELLHLTRRALGPRSQVTVTERWWNEDPN